MRTVETAVSALTEPARLARKGRRRRRRGSEEGARIRRLGRRELAGAFRNGRCRGWKRCSHCGQSRNKWTTSPLVAAMAAAIQTPSGGTDRFDEHRKRRIADQIPFVPRAARRQRDHAIEQRAPSLEEPLINWRCGVRFEAARRGLSDLVGRVAESTLLRDRLREAWGGVGQIVLLSGEAGIGKSRLAAQLAAEVESEPHTRLRYQCSPYHRDSVLYPFVVQLGRAARIALEDPTETQLKKLEAILVPSHITETAPLFASLLSIPTGERYPPLALSAAQQRRLTLAALLDHLEALARQKPVLMLFEDAHWADATSLEVLDLTVERVRALPVLMLITFRPEYEAPWTGLSHVTNIALDRFAPAEVETLAEHVAGQPLPPEVTAQIVVKTDGVPLFVEELTKTVLESGLLVAEPQGWRLDGPLPPFAIPATLQDSLAARLDRLAPVKEIAQIGAAIGREFSYPLLRAVAGRDEPVLRAALAQLEEAELLFRSGMPPDARYTFKHALVQDTAYETLLRSRRQILHRQIADALRGEFAAVAAAEPELVAHHLIQAGLDEPAIEW